MYPLDKDWKGRGVRRKINNSTSQKRTLCVRTLPSFTQNSNEIRSLVLPRTVCLRSLYEQLTYLLTSLLTYLLAYLLTYCDCSLSTTLPGALCSGSGSPSTRPPLCHVSMTGPGFTSLVLPTFHSSLSDPETDFWRSLSSRPGPDTVPSSTDSADFHFRLSFLYLLILFPFSRFALPSCNRCTCVISDPVSSRTPSYPTFYRPWFGKHGSTDRSRRPTTSVVVSPDSHPQVTSSVHEHTPATPGPS